MPSCFSAGLQVYILWQCCLTYTTSLLIVNGTLASPKKFYAVPWSKHIGNFTEAECLGITAELVHVHRTEILCEPLNGTKYIGRIAFIEEFYGSKTPNFQGCPHEIRYLNFVNAGAVGIVSWYNGNPGKYREVFASGFERNTGKVPLLSVGFDFSETAQQIIANSNLNLTVQLSCEVDEHWLLWNKIRTGLLVVVGGTTFLWGIRGIVSAWRMRRTTAKKSSVAMPVSILVMEGIILIFVGGSMALGIVGDSTESLFGYQLVGAQFRNFMYFGYTGYSFWTSILVAMYWRELRHALSSFEISRQIRNVFTTRVGMCIVGVTFILFALSEVVVVYLLSFAYLRIPGPAITGIVSLLNTGVSIFFIYQALGLRKFLGDSAKTMDNRKNSNKTSARETVENNAKKAMKEHAKHLAFWMQIYAACNLIQIALVVPMISIVNTTTGPGSTSFLLLVTLTRNGASIAKVEGLISPKLKNKGESKGTTSIAPQIEKNHTPLFTATSEL